jgi:N-acetylglucosaminyldiphosphoundecaprenol N-acetyl-beta-D-mannosaminyltransferase
VLPVASRQVVGLRVDATSYGDATARIIGWARQSESRYVCVANVHMVMEAHDSPDFQGIVNSADLVTPDGMPLVWMLRRLGVTHQPRVYGPALMLWVCEAAARESLPIGLYGGEESTLARLADSLHERYPGLTISYRHAPPFRPLTPEEDTAEVERIARSGARILFVGLGCPKQERWMAAHRDRITAVMLGVGAAFSLNSGCIRQATGRLQRLGLEWLFRLYQEPRRLWRRYTIHNPRFALLAARQLLAGRSHGR